ncbi:hypothetical protein OAC63_01210 [Amylibacter sp.]|jgi:hypothetical protein|nr:hypothetical protein [Amylibacter sp.]
MGKVIRFLLILIILGFLGLLGYSYLGDLSAPQTEVTVPVTLNGS